MLESEHLSEYDDPSSAFVGIRFVLFGFDPVREEKVRAALLEGGGVDVVNYGPDCTHVIVDKIVYDDPTCVAARRDGKILVTGLWVDDSFCMGMAADHTDVLYRPVVDLNGIPGAESLVVCLTGYQRQSREDIMHMVALMGATFSKPLVANKVTHLICYKFEGEKYELAKKMNMKLVNHRWLQDCLKAWELLPEDDYVKSGYELEMEAVAKDSEDETEDMAVLDLKKKSIISPQNKRMENKNSHQSPGQLGNSRNSAYVTAFESFGNVGSASKDKSTPRKETEIGKASSSHDMSNSSCARSPVKISSNAPANKSDAAEISGKASPAECTKNSVDGGLSSKNMKSSLPLRPERIQNKSGSPSSNVSKNELHGGFSTPQKIDLYGTDSHVIRSPSKGSLKKQTVPRCSSRSPVLSHSPNPLMKRGLISRTSIDGSSRSAFDMSPTRGNSSPREEISGGFVIPTEKLQDGSGSGVVKTPLKGKASSSPSKEKMNVSRSGSKSTKLSPSPNVNIHSEGEVDGFGSGGIKTPLEGVSLHLNKEQTSNTPSTKKLTVPRSNSKSTKLSRSRKTSMATKATEGLVSGSLVHESCQLAVDKSSPTSITRLLREEVSLASKEASVISALRENMQEYNGQTPQRSRGRPKKRSSPDSNVNEISLSRTKSGTAVEETHQSDPPHIEPISPSTSTGVEKSDVQADLNSSKIDLASKSKPLKKKTLARKTLGSKPTICKGKTTRNKGFLSSLLKNDFSGRSNGAVAVENTISVPTAEISVTVSPRTNEDVPVADGTETPKCEGPKEIDMGTKNLVEVEELHSEKTTPTIKEPSVKTSKTKKGASSTVKKSTEAKKSICIQEPELPESKSTDDVAEKKITEGKKRPLAKSKMSKSRDPTEEAKQEEKKSIPSSEETMIVASKTSKRPSKKLKRSDDVEKENEPAREEQQNVNRDKGAASKSTSHRLKKPLTVNTEVQNMKIEPACFILSGHRLQRKEFQQVIKRLRGKVCRDSHSWSYQATHFIVPDPIRRTEKFFAAAASGSWILKTDYLTASTEAGRFVSEEPYEWHKKCLTEDGAINLEAPRKWRLLRERTGRGAFYGMRIVIYGECIAPPLDTLKRVVKAGDGTILATSPPYTRFLDSGVDFAIVSPGMPRVDLWVQEFLQNEIPCILADYLVEYVCKPGFALDRHVQYNTHAWAKRSLENLIYRVEESVEDPKTPDNDNDNDNDVECRVCGERDRGDEMLICGDESGTLGCGVGNHIDCLDPPLEEVPEEDWFCLDCTRKRDAQSNRVSKKRAKKSIN